jgi:hypothetical protein
MFEQIKTSRERYEGDRKSQTGRRAENDDENECQVLKEANKKFSFFLHSGS